MRMAEEDFTGVIETNLTGAFRVVKRANRGMQRTRKGRVVPISSAASLAAQAGQGNYAVFAGGAVGSAVAGAMFTAHGWSGVAATGMGSVLLTGITLVRPLQRQPHLG